MISSLKMISYLSVFKAGISLNLLKNKLLKRLKKKNRKKKNNNKIKDY